MLKQKAIKLLENNDCKEPLELLNSAKSTRTIIEKKEFFFNGKKMQIILYPDSSIKAIVPLSTTDNWTGDMYSWYNSGAFLGCAGLVNGHHEGLSYAYHESGNIRAIANFKNTKQIEFEYQFNEEGKLKGAISFIEGKEHGLSLLWDTDTGHLKSVDNYKHGGFHKRLK